ncbi:unnamed protein product [Menidia menidia]|uniref:(Atlantic silverside) hypothetical protein n=1 Tax=Menidia menidia TaxID=238744 RepID=A0A8S4C337_9TELE|nr:unnamed protein product [Menidia menidia]
MENTCQGGRGEHGISAAGRIMDIQSPSNLPQPSSGKLGSMYLETHGMRFAGEGELGIVGGGQQQERRDWTLEEEDMCGPKGSITRKDWDSPIVLQHSTRDVTFDEDCSFLGHA